MSRFRTGVFIRFDSGRQVNDDSGFRVEKGRRVENKSKSKEISYEQDESGKKEKGRSWSPGV